MTKTLAMRKKEQDDRVARAQGHNPDVVSQAKTEALYADYANDYKRASLAENTRRTYAGRWRDVEKWCEKRGYSPTPPLAPTIVAEFLIHEARRGVKVASLTGSRSAIQHYHAAAGIPHAQHPQRDPHVMTIWEGIKREHGAPQRRAAPITGDKLRALVETLDDSLKGIRDRALLTLNFFSVLRRGEVVALTVADIRFVQKGLEVTIRKSKDDQKGRGATVGVPFVHDTNVCPIRALQAWLHASGITSGPLFRHVDKHGNIYLGALSKSGKAVNAVIKKAVEAAGLDPKLYSGHSMRRGFATSATQARKSERAIMKQGRWRSRATLDRYVLDAQIFGDDNAARGL